MIRPFYPGVYSPDMSHKKSEQGSRLIRRVMGSTAERLLDGTRLPLLVVHVLGPADGKEGSASEENLSPGERGYQSHGAK